MACIKGDCPEQGGIPPIEIKIKDNRNHRIMFGYYCNFECAEADLGACLKVLAKPKKE